MSISHRIITKKKLPKQTEVNNLCAVEMLVNYALYFRNFKFDCKSLSAFTLHRLKQQIDSSVHER